MNTFPYYMKHNRNVIAFINENQCMEVEFSCRETKSAGWIDVISLNYREAGTWMDYYEKHGEPATVDDFTDAVSLAENTFQGLIALLTKETVNAETYMRTLSKVG